MPNTKWTEQSIAPSTSWTEQTIEPSTSWTEQVIAPSTTWAEILEQFSLWADGNGFWEDINSNYEDL